MTETQGRVPRPAGMATAVLAGGLRPLGAVGVLSGIDKRPATVPLRLGRLGLEGDAQGDARHHGGPEKVVHHYPLDHHRAWEAEIGPRDILGRPGAFGENLSTIGLIEAEVAVGDVFSLGDAILEVSQGRQPCWKLNLRFSVPDMALRVQESGRCGWYYRVLREGTGAPGDRLRRLERRAPDWTLHRLWRVLAVETMDRDALRAMVELAPLAQSWRRLAAQRLDTGEVEDWTRRLYG